jgi:4-amino-4-deoxychorismate lyase
MSWHVLVNGESASAVSVSDRGLLYGDGLFETLLVDGGHIALWDQHLARFGEGCRRLALPQQDAANLLQEVSTVAAGRSRCVVRVTLTRGEGGRGYAPAAAAATRIVAAFPAPEVPASAYRDGVDLRWCEMRLARQPRLAGIKHLNRLEQVLARAEWQDTALADGLLLDSSGALTCATAANVFLLREGRLLTPRLHQAGVAGTCRAWIMQATSCIERRLGVADVEQADEVFIANSIRGILPVARIESRRYHPGPATRRLMHALHQAEPTLQPAP